MAKQKNSQKNQQQLEKLQEYKQEMYQLICVKDYVGAMDVMANIAKECKMDAETMYWGALCYYATSDFQRANVWVNHALEMGEAQLQGSIMVLLARLCQAQNRETDALTVLERVLEVPEVALTSEAVDGIEELLGGYEVEKLTDYPAVAEFAKTHPSMAQVVYQEPEQPVHTQQVEATQEPEGVANHLHQLLAQLQANQTEAIAEQQPATTNHNHWLQTEMLEQPAEPVAELEAEPEAELQPEAEIQTEAEMQTETEVETTGEAQPETATEPAPEVNEVINKIMAQPVGLQQKIELCHSFAAGFYQEDNFSAAYSLLQTALGMDANNGNILRALSYCCLSMGQWEEAQNYASQLQPVDFGLLYMLKLEQ